MISGHVDDHVEKGKCVAAGPFTQIIVIWLEREIPRERSHKPTCMGMFDYLHTICVCLTLTMGEYGPAF